VVSIEDIDLEVDRRTRERLHLKLGIKTLILVQRIDWEGISLQIYIRFSLEEFIRRYMSGYLD
jgi:hypothetical protein